PFVEARTVPRGSRVEGASIGNPTLTWGTAEGTSLTVFNTTSLAAAIDSTIYPVKIGLEVGRDFLSDSPADVGEILVANIGQRVMQEFDKMIAVGSGSSQPQGVFNASGIASVSSTNGTGGPLAIDDAENLAFAIGKQYRAAMFGPCYLM